MITWLLLVLLAFIGYCAGIVGYRFMRYQRISKGLLSERPGVNYTPQQARRHMLVAGDSIMHSAGVTDPDYTIAGLLATLYSDATVESVASNGARVQDVKQQLDSGHYQRYDLILIGVGGNDIVRLTSTERLKQELTALFTAASKRADKVIVCNSVNVGNIGFFPWPLTCLYDYRSRLYATICQKAADGFNNVQFVNFYRPLHDDYYNASTRHKFVASDGFHASEYANQFFFDKIKHQAGL